MTFRAAVLAATGLLWAGLAGPALADKPSAAGPAPTATEIRFDFISTPGLTVPQTPGTPASYIVQDLPFDVGLSFWGADDSGAMAPLPLSASRDTEVTVTGPGLSTTVDVAAGATSAELQALSLPDAADGVTLAASAPGPKRTEITGVSHSFDVLIDSSSDNRIGLDLDETCADTCARLVAPGEGFDGGALLSRGLCAPGHQDCVGGTYVQALAAFTGGDGVGTRADPATLVVTCDKSVCGVGAIQSHRLNVELVPGTAAVEAQPCPAKGVVGAGQVFCVDYVQSTRDNSGDTHLYLLFIQDAKVRWM